MMGMIVLKRYRNQRVVAERDGRRLYVKVCLVGEGHALLGFDGPYTVLREELLTTKRPPMVHLAGAQVAIGNYRVQRCLLCGEVLDEYDVTRLADGVEPKKFMSGHFYEFDGPDIYALPGGKKFRFDTGEALPPNCCLLETLKDQDA